MDAEHGAHEYSRRQVLGAAGVAAVAVPLAAGTAGPSRRAAALIRRPGASGAPQPEQVHVQFGADAAEQAAVSWAVPASVARPRLRLGRPAHGHGLEVPAEERIYTEALTGETVWTYHARLDRLQPDTQYVFEVLHDGATPVPGTFRTGPRGRSGGFRFTSFGDQAVPAPVGMGLGPNTPNAGFIVPGGRAARPAVPPVQRRPVLRQRQRRAGRHLGVVLQQQHPLGRQQAVDAVRRKS